MALYYIPIAFAQLLYIPYKRMTQQAYFYVACLLCQPFSVCRTLIYTPKRNVFDFDGNSRFGWETRNDTRLVSSIGHVEKSEESSKKTKEKILKILLSPLRPPNPHLLRLPLNINIPILQKHVFYTLRMPTFLQQLTPRIH